MRRLAPLALGAALLSGCGWLVGYDFGDARPMDASDGGAPDAGDDGKDGSGGLRETTGRNGSVLLWARAVGQRVVATFEESADRRLFAVEQVGPDCTVSFNVIGATPGTARRAGTVRVVRGSGATVASLSPGPDATYAPLTLEPAKGWTVDEPLVVRADGEPGQVPAFALETFGAGSVEVTSPPLREATHPITVPRSVDLPVTWRADTGQRGKVTVSLADSPSVTRDSGPRAGSINVVSCAFDSSAARGVVPARALAALQPGPGSFQVTPMVSTELDREGWRLSVVSMADGRESQAVTFE